MHGPTFRNYTFVHVPPLATSVATPFSAIRFGFERFFEGDFGLGELIGVQSNLARCSTPSSTSAGESVLI